jgi:N-glycosylase/DNA lyase
MSDEIAHKALTAIEKHTAECSMYRIGVNARLKRLERVIYTFVGLVIADYFKIFSIIKGIADEVI